MSKCRGEMHVPLKVGANVVTVRPICDNVPPGRVWTSDGVFHGATYHARQGQGWGLF